MHARKKTMADLSDGFVALPGGYGTLEELFEAVTWTQLNYHRKRSASSTSTATTTPLVASSSARRGGFVRPLHAGLVLVDTDPDRLLDRWGWRSSHARPVDRRRLTVRRRRR